MRSKDLRKAINTYGMMFNIFETMESNGIVKSPIEGYTLPEVFKMDMAEYIMYLTVADGVIDEREVSAFRALTGFMDDARGITAFIEENRDYLKGFDTMVPHSMKVAVELENIKTRSTGKKSSNALPVILLGLYVDIGAALILVDGNVTETEKENYNKYLSLLKDYLEEKGYL